MYNNTPFIKRAGVALFSVLLVAGALFSPPLQSRAEPTILATLIGGVASLFGVDFFSCSFNVLFYCDSGGNVVGSDGGGGTTVVQNPCTSSANACGQTNTGFLSSDGGTCSATPPPNSTCPAPVIGVGGFYAQPTPIGSGMSSTLHWTVTSATECDITSDVGFSAPNQPATGSISTGPVTATATYSLTCQNTEGGPTSSASTKVVVDPHYIEI